MDKLNSFEGVRDKSNKLVFHASASPCDFVQGWYYSKALLQEECEEFIRRYNKS